MALKCRGIRSPIKMNMKLEDQDLQRPREFLYLNFLFVYRKEHKNLEFRIPVCILYRDKEFGYPKY